MPPFSMATAHIYIYIYIISHDCLLQINKRMLFSQTFYWKYRPLTSQFMIDFQILKLVVKLKGF